MDGVWSRRRFTRRRLIGGAASIAGAFALGCTGRSQPVPGDVPAPLPASSTQTPPNRTPADWSIARTWDEEILAAIRIDRPRPPVHARNLYHLSLVMWDAWAAFDAMVPQLVHHERAAAPDREAGRRVAISHAAYGLIRHRYAGSPNAKRTLASLQQRMLSLGLAPDFTAIDGDSPAALGNRVFASCREMGLSDGANEQGNYAATNGYQPVNPPLVPAAPGANIVDPNRWQPLHFSQYVEQNGIPGDGTIQSFVCPHWASVTPFAISRGSSGSPYLDPGPPPRLGSPGDARYQAQFAHLVELSSQLDYADGTTLDISPGALGDNPVGTNSGSGHRRNPATGQPYAPNVVRRADWARCLAEYWADGPDSETPPGHWNVIANQVSDDGRTVRRLQGTGPQVDPLEWDLKLYLVLNGALHDAAVACWGCKAIYDSVRPISAIRYLSALGQSSDEKLPRYHPRGIPLIPGVIEIVTAESSAPGQRHEALAGQPGVIAVRSWGGPVAEHALTGAGAQWRPGIGWMTYQRPDFVTPAFPGYNSGHSTFSRAAAEVLAWFTGTPYFPGGLATVDLRPGFLEFEPGPDQPFQFQWATYFDAADAAGLSRLYGGIHIEADDFAGRRMGQAAGNAAIARATQLFARKSG